MIPKLEYWHPKTETPIDKCSCFYCLSGEVDPNSYRPHTLALGCWCMKGTGYLCKLARDWKVNASNA